MEGQSEHDAKEHSGAAPECRSIVDSAQVGGIIGKGGVNVKKVREETGCIISILKSDFRNVSDRIMVLRGTALQQANAVGAISRLVLESLSQKKQPEESFAFRLLVHKAAVGAVIGKGGQSIKDTQASSGCRIQIANDALPNSTEKVVTITGAPDGIVSATYRILSQQQENPLRADTRSQPYVPGVPSFPAFPFSSPLAFNPMGGYSPALSNAFNGIRGFGGLGAQQQQQQQQFPNQSAKIKIPSHTAGSVIGKGGSIMRDLRMRTSCSISIADADPNNANERVVTISGTQQGVTLAQYLITYLVEHYQPQPGHGSGQHSGQATSAPQY